jgi:hypothetical protein
MNPEKSHNAKRKREFSGCIELIPPPPVLIEFVTSNRIWGFPIQQLNHFNLGSNPEHNGKKSLPPDLLALSYDTSIVFLFGWRLELIVGPLMSGRVARIHAEKHLGTLMIEEAWISEIKIIPRLDAERL